MLLQNLLEDKRNEWQKAAQEQILSSLLCKSHRYKEFGQSNDKLVMVVGKSHAGKTTFILSLMGVAESKLSRLNAILRAGIPEGESSTSTAIIYQRSDDNDFGICERCLDELSEVSITKCKETEFVEKLKEIRATVERNERDKGLVLYLYIPSCYFENDELSSRQLNILDVPGYETTNEKEGSHTNAILKKYMSVSVLNIVVISAYSINDLRYFCVPNGDNYTKLASGKYIVVTTRSYSSESIVKSIKKYFEKMPQNREHTFEEMLREEYYAEFEKMFGTQIPKYFLLDIGESFNELLKSKITDKDAGEEIIAYRKQVFDEIYQIIDSKQSNTLFSWVKEVSEDEKYYSKEETDRIERKIDCVKENLIRLQQRLKKEKERCECLQHEFANLTEMSEKMPEIAPIKNECMRLREDGINSWIEEKFTKDSKSNLKWKGSDKLKDYSVLFAELFLKMRDELIDRLSNEFDEFISEKIKQGWKNKFTDDEIRTDLYKEMYPHEMLTFLNPNAQEKINIGRSKVEDETCDLINSFCEDIKKECEEQKKENERKEQLITQSIEKEKKKMNELQTTIQTQKAEMGYFEKEKEDVKKHVEEDQCRLKEYRKIANENFERQKYEVLEWINQSDSPEEKVEYLILLGLMDKDYRKIVMG